MRFLIAASVLACVAAELSPVALTPAIPKISVGDINGAVREVNAEVNDHVRANYDKVNELHGQAINHAHDQAWKAVDNVKTIEARWDGAAAASAPALSKHLVRTGQAGYIPQPVAPSYVAPSYAAPNYAAQSYAANYAAPNYAAQNYAANYAAQSYAAPEVNYPAYENYAEPAVAASYDAPVVSYAPESDYAAPYPYYQPEFQGFY